LSRKSFRFPHFGDWTHDGQPLSQGQPARSAAVSPTQPSIWSNPRRAIPDAARVAVVDEDCRAPGLVVEVGRKPADVPAVAHRPEWKERDHRVLGRVERAEEPRHLVDAVEHPVLGRYQTPRSRTSSRA
jgi:hypothetical protein